MLYFSSSFYYEVRPCDALLFNTGLRMQYMTLFSHSSVEVPEGLRGYGRYCLQSRKNWYIVDWLNEVPSSILSAV